MKALIIEDEVTAAKHLNLVLEEVGGFSVVAVLESIRSVIDWFNENPMPEIVFMDIHLADGSAFEIFEHITIDCPIIFTTAYDEYALKAFKVNSIAYLLKPIDPADVKEGLNKLKNLTATGIMHQAVEKFILTLRNSEKYKHNFLVPSSGDKLIPVQVSDIAFFYLEANIVKAYTFRGEKFRFEATLSELENQLNPQDFFRANRQFIITRNAIKDIDLWFASRLSVNLKLESPEKILISKARITEFKKWFTG